MSASAPSAPRDALAPLDALDQGDPGLAGVVPFRFACHRCGHCCSAPEGVVWLAPGEEQRLAQALGLSEQAFAARFVHAVEAPADAAAGGGPRRALRDDPLRPGTCALLAGVNHCSVYDARPAQCRAFPYWPAVLSEPVAFERAREVCPGIAVEVPPDVRARAFAALAALYREVDAFVEQASPVCLVRGVCCRFEEAGHRLFASALEADYAAQQEPQAPPPEQAGRCPYHVAGKCTARAARPLACRVYFCDARTRSVLEEAHEHFLARLRALQRAHGYPSAYADFPALLAARGVGRGAALAAGVAAGGAA